MKIGGNRDNANDFKGIGGMNGYWKFLERISQGSLGLFMAYTFLTYAVPIILIAHLVAWLLGIDDFKIF